jgi:hypothetical protein
VGITITEALAEIKTINSRLAKKREFVNSYLARQEAARDPLEKDGGSAQAIERERQSINDLEHRLISIRRGIQRANDTTLISIGGMQMSISEWLTWRRDVAPGQRTFLQGMRDRINAIRAQAQKQGGALVSATASAGGESTNKDIVVNVDERVIADEIEALETTLGTLDGQLSLKNATVFIEA